MSLCSALYIYAEALYRRQGAADKLAAVCWCSERAGLNGSDLPHVVVAALDVVLARVPCEKANAAETPVIIQRFSPQIPIIRVLQAQYARFIRYYGAKAQGPMTLSYDVLLKYTF